jgi:hypothetical protein
MPSVSKKQHGFMAAIANNPKFAKKVGVSKSVGEDYMKADKGRKFKQGGLKETDAESNPGLAKLPTEVRNKMGYMKKGGMAKMRKFADGGLADAGFSAGSNKTGRTPEERALAIGLREGSPDFKLAVETLSRQKRNEKTAQEMQDLLPSREKIGSALRSKLDPQTVLDMAMPQAAIARRVAEVAKNAKMPKSYSEESGMSAGLGSKYDHKFTGNEFKKGGMAHEDKSKDKPMMEKVAKKAVKGHEKKMHGMKAGGTFRSSADGIASKGKTKGTMVGMKKGGAC